MSRRPASVTQADVARAIRAAKQAGAHSVEVVQRNGTTIRVVIDAPQQPKQSSDRDIIL
jgi:hypothetical protein